MEDDVLERLIARLQTEEYVDGPVKIILAGKVVSFEARFRIHPSRDEVQFQPLTKPEIREA